MADKPSASIWVQLRGDIGRLEVDMKKAVGIMVGVDKSIGRLTKNIEKSFNGISAAAVKFSAVSAGINQSLEVIKKGARAIAEVVDSIGQGDTILAVEKSFKELQQTAGRDSVAALEALQKATLGTVDNLELMKQANSAVILGIPIEKLDQMAEAATKLGRAVGNDATKSIQSLVEGLGRGSTEMLDNIGIVVKADEAQQAYAEAHKKTVAALTDTEKRLAFQQAAFAKIAEESKKFGEEQITAGLAAKQLQTAFENLTQEFLKNLATNDDLRDALIYLGEELSKPETMQLAADVAELTANMVALGAYLSGSLLGIMQTVSDVVSKLSGEFNNLFNLIRSVAGAANSQTLRQEALKAAAAQGKDIRNTEEIIQSVMKGQNTFADYQKSLGVLKETAPALKKVEEAAKTGTVASTKASAESKKAATAAKKLADEKQRLSEQWQKLNENVKSESLSKALQESVKALDSTSFDVLKYELEAAVFNSTYAGLEKMLEKGVISPRDAERYSLKIAETSREEWEDKMSDAVSSHTADMQRAAEENAEYTRQRQEEAYRQSTDFFRDAFASALDPQSTDLSTSLKQLAVGFAAEIAAATSSGITEGAASLEDIGATVAKGLGITDMFASLFSSVPDYTQNNPQGFYGPGGDPSGSGQGQASSGADAGAYMQVGMQALGAILSASDKNKQTGSQAGTGQAVGTVAGGTIGAVFGGPAGAMVGAQIGGMAGEFAGGFLGRKSSDPGEKARNAFEDWIEESLQKLSTVAFYGANGLQTFRADKLNFVKGDASRFNETFNGGPNDWGSRFNATDQAAGNVFSGLALGMKELLGITEDVSSQMGAMLAENLGGSVDNARLLVAQLGLSLEDMEASLVEVGLSGEKSWHEIEVGLQGVNKAFGAGLEAVGDVRGAFEALEGSGGRGVAALKAVRDMAVESLEQNKKAIEDAQKLPDKIKTKEKGKHLGVDYEKEVEKSNDAKQKIIDNLTSIEQLKEKLLASGVSEQEVGAIMQAMQQRGIKTLEDLANASDRVAGGIVADIQSASEGMSSKWEQVGKDLDDINQKLEDLPTAIQSNVTINVDTNMSEDARQAIEAINSGNSSATIDLPEVGMAKGGIIASRTRFGNVSAGENGAEAILPLKQMANGNLGVASAGGRGGQPISINIDARGAEAGVEQRIRSEIAAMGDYAIRQSIEIVSSELSRGRY